MVSLQLPNLPQFLVAYFGALKAGMVVLPLNPLLKAPEIEYHLSDSGAAILIGFDSIHQEAAKACELLGVPAVPGQFQPGPAARGHPAVRRAHFRRRP